MGYEDLEQHDLFLPEEAWGETDLSSSVAQGPLVGVFVLFILACVLMAIGGGGFWTWIGAFLFPVALLLFTVISNRGIESQNDAIEEIRREHS